MANKFTALLIAVLFTVMPAGIVSAEEELPPYNLRVDVTNQFIYVYRLEPTEGGSEYVLMDYWACTSGAPGSSTPLGTYNMRPLSYSGNGDGEWYFFRMWSCWINYVTQFNGNCCFHSPPQNTRGNYQRASLSNIRQLLSARSHGCIRVLPRQAAFVWFNMGGCKVEIFRGEATDETYAIREDLQKTVPQSVGDYPDPMITRKTKIWYTYHGDTAEKICELSWITPEQLQEYNPGVDFGEEIPVGIAVRIRP